MKGNKKVKETVRDGYFCDLPEDLQRKVIDANKIISNVIDETLNDPAYADLKDSNWAMSCIDDFRTAPTAKGEVGSVRIFRKGSKFECMIQATGHFRNHQYGWIEELLHDFIRDIHQSARTTIRKKHDLRLDDEGSHGNSFEGFDVYPSSKIAKEMWDKFEDRKTKALTEDGYEIDLETGEIMFEKGFVPEVSDDLALYYELYKGKMSYDDYFNERSHGKLKYSFRNGIDTKNDPLKLGRGYHKESTIVESSTTPEYNVEMSESQAKKTLRTLSQGLINDFAKDKNKKVTQYTANIYANIITKNLLPKWANGYRKFSIVLDSYQSFFTFEFKVPTMSQDFISRYINGREPINAFLHRIPEIKVKMSPRIFHTMKDPDDAFNFFKAAIKYYDSGIEKYSKSLMSEAMKLNHNMKHLISTTKLSGIVTYPMQLLFVFDDVHMDNKNTFSIDQNDIKKINQFFKNIYTNYAAPEKEKKKIVEDVKEMVKVLRESCEYDENIKSICYLPEEVDKFLSGRYDDQIEIADSKFIREQVDFEDMKNQKDPQVTYLQEKFGVKKLKKIPTDLVAYISIETEAIRDANDKMMIASYTLGKIEIVEWYIELLDTGSKKYVVPHTKPYLETVRTQLLACYKKIMDTPIPKNNDRPLIDVKYPKGYEG